MKTPTNDERITALEIAVKEHDGRLEEGGAVIKQIKDDLASNTASTKRVESSTDEIVDFFNSVKGAFKVLNWIGKLAKPLGAIIAFCVALWTAWLAFAGGSHPR